MSLILQRTTADHREDVIDLFPAVFMTVKMKPDSTGQWLLHCHVNDHMVHGMEALYDVEGSCLNKIAASQGTRKKQGFKYRSIKLGEFAILLCPTTRKITPKVKSQATS
jgi:hypothetical protein